MSDTPETDALVENIGMGCQMVDAAFARKLERERNAARAEVARLRRQSKQWKLAAKDWRRFTFYMWRRYRAELAKKEAAK